MSEQQQDIVGSDEFVGSRDVRTGYLSGPGFMDVPVRYNVVDGIAIFDGCIDMGPAEEVEGYAATVRTSRSRSSTAQAEVGGMGPGAPSSNTAPQAADVLPPSEVRGVGLPPESAFLWTNGIVPFVLDSGLSNQGRVTQAIAHIHANTGIRFVTRTSQANYIRFVRNPDVDWSSSPIGMRGGEQLIRISDGATMGTVVHECMHSLGVLHEQSRCDRDQFVTINYQNIRDGFESNFDRFCDGYRDYFEYDYGSIMHYPATAFTKNGQPTIVPVQSGVTIGQRDGMSVIDRLTIAEMYSRFTGHGHTGVWREVSGAYGLWVNATWEDFTAKWNEWGSQGLRLVDLHVGRVGSELRYSGVWLAGSGGYGLWVNATWDSFKAKWEEWAAQGLRLVDLHVLRQSGGEFRYSGVFRAGTGGYGLWTNASWDSFKAKWEEWAAQGLRLVDINVVNVNGADRYSGVWLPGSGGYGLWANASWDSFKAKWQQWAGQGLRLVDINVHESGGATRYSGAFLPGGDAYYLWANVPWESLRARWEQLASQGLRLVDYEFTEPATAGAEDLDAAGIPVVSEGMSDLPEGVGGVSDGSRPVTASVPTVTTETTTDEGRIGLGQAQPVAGGAAGDGDGGAQIAGHPRTPTSNSDGDGQGGYVLRQEGTAGEYESRGPDGDGGVVVGSQFTAGTDGSDGAGSSVTTPSRGAQQQAAP